MKYIVTFVALILLASGFIFCKKPKWINLKLDCGAEITSIAANSKGDVFCTELYGKLYKYNSMKCIWDTIYTKEKLARGYYTVIVDENDLIFTDVIDKTPYLSADNGETWQRFGNDTIYHGILGVNNKSDIFGLTGNFPSTPLKIMVDKLIWSDSLHWKRILEFPHAPQQDACFDGDGNLIMAINEGNFGEKCYVYKYDIKEKIWSLVGDSLTDCHIHAIAADDDNNIYRIFYDVNNYESRLEVMYDGGKEWREVYSNLYDYFGRTGLYYDVQDFIAINSREIYLPTPYDGGLIKNNGDNYLFNRANEGLEEDSVVITCFYLDKRGHIYLGTEEGNVYKSESSVTEVKEEVAISNNEFIVYPNPLNSDENLTLEIKLKRKSLIRIEMVNELGVKVKDIYDGFLPSGREKIHINRSNLSFGAYWINIIIDNVKRISKPVIIL